MAGLKYIGAAYRLCSHQWCRQRWILRNHAYGRRECFWIGKSISGYGYDSDRVGWWVFNGIPFKETQFVDEAHFLQGAPIAGYLLNAYGGEQSTLAAYHPAIFYAGSMALGASGLVAIVRLKINTSILKKL